MHVKVTELDDAVRDMHTKQMANNAKGLMEPHHVHVWLAEVEQIKSKVERIPTGGVGCSNIKMRYETGKQSYDIIKVINRLMKEKADMVLDNERIPPAMVTSPRPSTLHDDDQNKNGIKSRDLKFKDALKSLASNDAKTQMMALCGMGGVGKTTMMEELRNAAKDRKMFDWIVKADVGQNPNPLGVQQAIADYLGEALVEITKGARAESLQKRFKKISEEGEKKVLVILDDVWEEFNIKDIGLTSPLPNGFKLMLTSRDENVCTRMGVETSSIFRIGVLEESEANILFWEIARLASDSDIEPDLHEIGEKIIKRCGGLPIALKTIASTLRDNKEKYAWEDAWFRLHNKEFSVHNIFEISYNNLKMDCDKAIFLLSGLFPDDYTIGIEDLLRYGWGLKVFKNVRTLAQARSRVNTCVYNLIRSNLLIKSDREGCVKMHDLVRDFVLSNFSKVKQASIMNHDSNVYEHLKEDKSYERILLKCGGMYEFPVEFNHPNLTLLMLMDGDKQLKFPEDFYTRMGKLEVVAYENMHRPLLPRYSTNIRALLLYSCWLINDDISFIGDLVNLEVLSLAHCRILKLPFKIGTLKKLKLLDLTGCAHLCIDDGVFKNLDNLEELYMRVSRGIAIRFTDANFDELKTLSRKLSALEVEFVDNNAQLKHISFEKLERFRISMGCPLKEDKYNWDRIDKYSFKNTLKLVASSVELLECKINELFTKTEILYLEVNDMSCVEDILMYPPQNSFGNLKKLYISKCAGLTYLFTSPVAKSLMKLEILKIQSCRVLKSVIHGEDSGAQGIKFDKLKLLSLKDLPELISLCNLVHVMELPQLVELNLDKLPNFTSIFPENNINIHANQPFLNKEVEIPNLEKLKIRSMKNLKKIWPCDEEVNDMLREIIVERCNGVVDLFPCNPLRLLSHLEKISVDSCHSIEALLIIELGKIKQLNSSSFRSIDISSCASFREVWRIKDVENNYSGHLICGFQAIESICISSCKRFKNIVTPTTVNFDMRALNDITIRSCKEYGVRKNEIVKNTQEQQIISVSKEDISKVDDNMSVVAFPSYRITQNFNHLRKMHFDRVQGVEVLFEIESPSNNRDHLVTTQQQQPPLLPYLEDLVLSRMDALTHVWKCSNWNEFFIHHKHQPQSSFQNLTSISLVDCESIKYLFSPLMLKLLSNLKNICFISCHGMKEVVSKGDGDDEVEEVTASTLLPHLNLLEFYLMDNLKHIGGYIAKGTTNVTHSQPKFSHMGVDSWSLCQYSREIRISFCHALSSVIPSYAAGRMQKLQVLLVEDCRSMMEVFETREIKNNNIDGCSTSTNVDPGSDTTVAVPSLRNITIHELPNLKTLKINKCNRLVNVFTLSTLESLKNLEALTIRNCGAMKVIVREEYVEQTTTSSKCVAFPHLKSIELDNLPNLTGFFLEMNIDFHWPLLDYVLINDCPEVMAFTSGQSTAPRLKNLHTKLGKHNLECGLNFRVTPSPSLDGKSLQPYISERRAWSFHNLIECDLDFTYGHTKIFPSSELQQLQKLETIHANNCEHVKTVFEVALEVTNNESPTVVTFPKLREAELKNLWRLEYIWKSHPWRTLKFPNLTRLHIEKCELKHVFTCSMVGCVMQLQELHIKWCSYMEEIVKEEEDQDVKASEITFPCLKSLKLDGLSSLKGFSLAKEDFALPSLDTLEINVCREISVFTMGRSIAPKLKIVETSVGYFNVGEDINSFIVTKLQEGYKFD